MKTVTIQKTAKPLKAQSAFATLLFIGTIVYMAWLISVTPQGIDLTLGTVASGCGLVWLLVTKFRIWWGHG